MVEECSAPSPGGWDPVSHNGILFWLIFIACPHSPTPYWCFLGFHSKSTCQKIIVSWSASGEPELRQSQPQNFHINFFSWEAVSLKGNLPVALLCRFGAHCFGKCFRLCNSCLWIWLIRIKCFFFQVDYGLNNHKCYCKQNAFRENKTDLYSRNHSHPPNEKLFCKSLIQQVFIKSCLCIKHGAEPR